jgi:hypothetical protein
MLIWSCSAAVNAGSGRASDRREAPLVRRVGRIELGRWAQLHLGEQIAIRPPQLLHCGGSMASQRIAEILPRFPCR